MSQHYNLANDATELKDLADSKPDEVKRLLNLYENRARNNNVLPWDNIVKNKNNKL